MLEDAETVDLMGSRDEFYYFCITDAGITPDVAERHELLRQKLTTYINAISWGQIGDKSVPRKNYRIEIICRLSPSDYSSFTSIPIMDEHGQMIRIPIEVRQHHF